MAARRKKQRRLAVIGLVLLALMLLGLVIYGLWQPAVRVSHVTVYGADHSLAHIATSTMTGAYLGIVPRNSTFFLPESRIRSAILADDPTIAAVSLFRDGFSGLAIKVDYRVPVARWCNTAESIMTASSTLGQPDCYVFDAGGFVFATSSETAPVNDFVVEEKVATSTPIASMLPDAPQFPAAFGFARQLAGSFGSSVTDIVFRGDEIDDYLRSGTRVTYVAGQEQNAFSALLSARAKLNLADGSILYVDLRFPGKIYLKRK